ncbi:MAG: hypothetical protein IBX62_04935 [Coriobacteriia bacterium]|nr:hypothetical protein [Coriobacteriia bacterium]
MSVFVRTGAVCDPERMNFERIAARGVVVGGGVFWVAAAFSGPYAFKDVPFAQAVGTAAVPFALTVFVLLLGWWFERAAALLLYGLSGAGVLWGLVAGWEPALWVLVAFVFIVPMLIAGGLFHLAARMESICGGPARALSLLASTVGTAGTVGAAGAAEHTPENPAPVLPAAVEQTR